MQIKLGKYGRFLTCERFPECDGIKSLEDPADIVLDPEKYVIFDKCDKDDGKMELKKSKFGTFWACENYPNCKNTKGMTLVEKCPECDHNLVERKGKWGKMFTGCSNYPKCKFIKKEVSDKATAPKRKARGRAKPKAKK
jgi:DNA topoisomerase I